MSNEREKKEMSEMAYSELVGAGKHESACRLRRAIDGIGMIVLSLSDIDWDIQTALERVGFEQSSVRHGGASATFILT